MDQSHNPPLPSDRSPARPLEVSAALAAAVEEVLVSFAAKAELDTALVVDLGGALVSGISSEDAEEIDVVSVLAAGACGAIRALAKRLGEPGEIESFHHGSEQVVYLGGVGTRFLLVGVCRSGTAIGAIREEARQVRPSLASLLATMDETREAAARRALALAAGAGAPSPPPPMPLAASQAPAMVPSVPAIPTAAPADPASPPRGGRVQAVISEITRPDPEPEPLPTEIIEYLGAEEPEIVVEPSPFDSLVAPDSPFEIEEDDDGDDLLGHEDGGPSAASIPAESLSGSAAGADLGIDWDGPAEAGGSISDLIGSSIFELDDSNDEVDFGDFDLDDFGRSDDSDLLVGFELDDGEVETESALEVPSSSVDETPAASVAGVSVEAAQALAEEAEVPRSLFSLAGEPDEIDFEAPPVLGATGLLGEEPFEFAEEEIFEFVDEDEEAAPLVGREGVGTAANSPLAEPEEESPRAAVDRAPADPPEVAFEIDAGEGQSVPEPLAEIFEEEETDEDENEDSGVAKRPLYF